MERVKEDIVAYWTRRAPSFADLRMRELGSPLHRRWLDELESALSAAQPALAADPLRILDAGCGTGFFSLMLADRGHDLTGIDLTGEMVAEARAASGRLGVPAAFHIMDAENPDLPAHAFDVIVTRNLTWGLPHLARAYAAWHELLVPGGVLVNFDADYCRENNARGGAPLPACGAHRGLSHQTMDAYERIKDELRPSQEPRPAWDLELLKRAGFHDVQVDEAVYQRIYIEEDEFYNPTPIFKITARA